LHSVPTSQEPCALHRRAGECGYAYVMALAMVLMVIAGSQIVLRNVVIEARAQKEADMIWRGNQYARAIRNYYRKTGHFPQSQDDLLTGVPGLHFLRAEALKDPMNKESDGEWRFIYMNASGAIIGSVKYGSLNQMALMDMNGGLMPGGQQGNSLFPSDSNNQNSNSTTDPGNQNNANNGSGLNATNMNTPNGTNGVASGNSNASPQQNGNGLTNGTTFGQPVIGIAATQPTGPVDSPVFGATIIGVGSKVDKASVKVYKGGKKYNQWEFIWNPLEEQARAVQQGLSGGGVGGAAGITNGLGSGGLLPLGQMPGGATPTNGAGGNTNGTNNNGSNSTNDPNNPNGANTPQQ
jgi:hypothetical protein